MYAGTAASSVPPRPSPITAPATAHAHMLHAQQIIGTETHAELIRGLTQIQSELAAGTFGQVTFPFLIERVHDVKVGLVSIVDSLGRAVIARRHEACDIPAIILDVDMFTGRFLDCKASCSEMTDGEEKAEESDEGLFHGHGG